jgi:hypothetical protein
MTFVLGIVMIFLYALDRGSRHVNRGHRSAHPLDRGFMTLSRAGHRPDTPNLRHVAGV